MVAAARPTEHAPGNAPRRRLALWRVAWLAYWLALFVVMHVPLPPGPGSKLPWLDKIAHAGLYFLLAWLGARCVSFRGAADRVGTLLRWTAVYAAYAGLDEWLQRYVGRTPSYGDFAADMVGVIAATGLAIAAHRRNTGS